MLSKSRNLGRKKGTDFDLDYLEASDWSINISMLFEVFPGG